MKKYFFFFSFIFLTVLSAISQTAELPVKGWAKTSVNAVVFRENAVITHDSIQYVAFYDSLSRVVLAKRHLGTINWEVNITQYTGNVADAHNSISIVIDGDGYLHMAWDMHNAALKYCKSITPNSLELGAITAMIGSKEVDVTYPQFYKTSNGDILFFYRNGESGNGDLVINKYVTTTGNWTRLHNVLISGEGKRNAYWQTHVDENGVIHLSWVWRETWDVATNHDLCYARSFDEGVTWEKTTGEKYSLPITAATAEYAAIIPQKSELINQTTIYGDSQSRPYIANYWTPSGTNIPQYHLVYHDGLAWKITQVSNRTTPFSLSGGGTKKIPISRPKILVEDNEDNIRAFLIFRDLERSDKVSILFTPSLADSEWKTFDATDYSVSSWEPNYDTELWNTSKGLHIFVQRVGQGDGEGQENLAAQTITILSIDSLINALRLTCPDSDPNCVVTSLDATTQNGYIYPTTTSEVFNFIQEDNNFDSYLILNSSGIVIKRGELNNNRTQISVSDIIPGFYFIKVYGEREELTKKLFIH